MLERQVRRMLADERSRSLVTNFAFQWLGVRRLDAIDPDPRLYPNFDEDLRRAFTKEMELYPRQHPARARSVVDLLTANHTFVNERLARHYGLPDVRGDQFRRIELDDSRPFRLVRQRQRADGHVVSRPHVAGAARRVDHGADPRGAAEPAAARRRDRSRTGAGDVPKSVRERLALHRTQPSCNQCHGVIDPLGQALENFNAVGEWRERERDSGVLVDSTGTMATGQPVNSPEELRAALIERSDAVRACTDGEAAHLRHGARRRALRHARRAPHRGGRESSGL